MGNPLHKRLLRELISEFPKYLVIFILLVGTIGMVSGFLVADESMIQAYDESFDKFNIEDGHFHTEKALNKAQIKAINQMGVTLYPQYYQETLLTNGSTMRIYANRTKVNLLDEMKGRLPQNKGEMAIDRMYADNNDLDVGDMISDQNHSYTICGLVALSDYSALFSDNNDMMFDALKFGVAVVTQEDFEQLNYKRTYEYAWIYDEAPVDEQDAHDKGEDLMEALNGTIALEDFIPQYMNQAIIFTGDDMGSDRAMMMIVLYILIAIVAFVFAVTISNTITQEANVIGTLRASGYSRSELIRHYMMMPLIVTLVSGLVGNILGYTIFKIIFAGLYYNSYSLPTYVTIWSVNAFIETTIVPIILMLIINYVILKRKLSLSPLKFIRRDLSRKVQKRTIKLPHRFSFMSRFRIRVILQNLSNYVVLFVGIMFADMLLMFGLGLPDMLDNYQKAIETHMIAPYQYVLKVPANAMDEHHKLESAFAMLKYAHGVETDEETAEKFSAYTLRTLGDQAREEDIMLYGIEKRSSYLDLGEADHPVVISSTYAEKYHVKAGDVLHLKEKYEEKSYDFTVTSVYDYPGAVCLFMTRSDLNRLIDVSDSYFSGYFSKKAITDLDEQYVGTVIDLSALTKVSRQLDHSMGSMMLLVEGVAIVMFLVLIYLLSKIIIDKNAQAISMTKILGYENKEIFQLYVSATTIVVIVFAIIIPPIAFMILKPIFFVMMKQEMTGWIPFTISRSVFVRTTVYAIIAYLVVALLEYRKIQSVPMGEALKNVE